MCYIRVRVWYFFYTRHLIHPKYFLSLSEKDPYVLNERYTFTIVKPTLGLAVRLSFKYKKSLLEIVGCVGCQECQC